jgi:hypothetical protein
MPPLHLLKLYGLNEIVLDKHIIYITYQPIIKCGETVFVCDLLSLKLNSIYLFTWILGMDAWHLNINM